jgi:hypothetical protein
MCVYIYGHLSLSSKAKFCGMPSCAFDKLKCAASEKMVMEHCSRSYNDYFYERFHNSVKDTNVQRIHKFT